MVAFDHLEWTYDVVFEQLSSLRRWEFEQKVSKNSNAWGGEGCLSFNLTVTLLTVNCYSISVTGNNTVNIQSRAKRDHRYMAILRNIHINYK